MPEIFSSPKNTHSKAVAKPDNIPVSTLGPVAQALSAFMVRPDGIKFETQEAKEEILLFMRRHLITNVPWVFSSLVLLVIPLIIVPLLVGTQTLPAGLPPGYFLILPLLWYLGTFGFVLVNFLHWYFNVYIVTNERVVDIDWENLLYKQISSTQLEKIQDVTYKQGGIIDSFFDFGNVYIQTAGTEPNFEFDAVPKPEHVVRQINAILEKTEE